MIELEKLFCELLWRQLQSMGLFTEKYFNVSELMEQNEIHESFQRWLEVSARFLAEKKYITFDGQAGVVIDLEESPMDIVWSEWEQQKQVWLEEDNTKAQVVLVETMIHSLPDILTRKKLATDVMFPQSSFE